MLVGVEDDVGQLGRQVRGQRRQQVRATGPDPVVAVGSRVAEVRQPVGDIAEVGVVGHPQRDHRAVGRLAEELPLGRRRREPEARLQRGCGLQQRRPRREVGVVGLVEEGRSSFAVDRASTSLPTARRTPSQSVHEARSVPAGAPATASASSPRPGPNGTPTTTTSTTTAPRAATTSPTIRAIPLVPGGATPPRRLRVV